MKNLGDLLVQATSLPTAIEAKLPTGAPKLSTMLLNTAGMLPKLPDLPVTLPDLPAVPELPAMPAGLGKQTTKYVTAVEVVPVEKSPVTPLVQSYTQPIEGVVGTVTSRRGM